MSLFDGYDLFGSGAHRVIWGTTETSSHNFAFPGEHGSYQVNNGMSWRTGRITGVLRANTALLLTGLENDIMQYTADGGKYRLTDNFDVYFDNVVLGDYRCRGPRKVTSSGEHLQEYDVPFKCLVPV